MRVFLAVMLVLGACTAGSDAAPRTGIPSPVSSPSPFPASGPPSMASPAPEPPCTALTRTACMQSTTCTLEQEAERSKRYRCRPSEGPCEQGFAQASFWGSGSDGVRSSLAQQGACSARPGCAFVDGGCYCHCRGMGETAVPDGDEAPACVCECGRGPPPSCRAAQ